MRMRAQVRKTAEKASKVLGNISRFLPNIGGPREGNRKIICSVFQSIMLYGAIICKRAMEKQIYRNILLGVQRKAAIRIASGYRTASTKTLLVTARTPPIDLLADRKRRT
ncbi:hypothetical protein JTB14_020517 [Gonioctena quinquepunctata]|nr:hypothetical protein JTB14_020517 [Gonioctena quinquepunctata]